MYFTIFISTTTGRSRQKVYRVPYYDRLCDGLSRSPYLELEFAGHRGREEDTRLDCNPAAVNRPE